MFVIEEILLRITLYYITEKVLNLSLKLLWLVFLYWIHVSFIFLLVELIREWLKCNYVLAIPFHVYDIREFMLHG